MVGLVVVDEGVVVADLVVVAVVDLRLKGGERLVDERSRLL